MKRAIALVVIVAYLMQLTGCAIHLSHRFRPNGESILEDDVIRGVITQAGEQVRFGTQSLARVKGDTLYFYRGERLYKLALDDVQELLVVRKDPTLSTIATVALCATIIVALYGIGKAMANLDFTPDISSIFEPPQTH